MDKHALAILKDSDFWNWHNPNRIQEQGSLSRKLESVTPKLLYYLILESQNLGTGGGQLLDHFWYQLGNCDNTLKVNSETKISYFLLLSRLTSRLSQSKV